MSKLFIDVLDSNKIEAFKQLRAFRSGRYLVGGTALALQSAGMPLFNLADLASNKAFTVGKRGVWRDYVDLFYLLKSGLVSLDQIIKETEKRFGDQFSAKLFLEQLVYNKDIFDFRIDYIGKKYTPEEVMLFLEKAERDYLVKNVLI